MVSPKRWRSLPTSTSIRWSWGQRVECHLSSPPIPAELRQRMVGDRLRVRVVLQPILAPLPCIAVHFVQSPGIWRETADGRRLASGLRLLSVGVGEIPIVIRLVGRDRLPQLKGAWRRNSADGRGFCLQIIVCNILRLCPLCSAIGRTLRIAPEIPSPRA